MDQLLRAKHVHQPGKKTIVVSCKLCATVAVVATPRSMCAINLVVADEDSVPAFRPQMPKVYVAHLEPRHHQYRIFNSHPLFMQLGVQFMTGTFPHMSITMEKPLLKRKC